MPRHPASVPRPVLAALLLLAAGPAAAADGFTQSSLFLAPAEACLPVGGIVAGLAGEHAVCLAGQLEALPDDDADWRAWWREWGAWSPFASPGGALGAPPGGDAGAGPAQARLGAVEGTPGGGGDPAGPTTPGIGGGLALAPAMMAMWPGTSSDFASASTRDTHLATPAGGEDGTDSDIVTGTGQGTGDGALLVAAEPPPTPFGVIAEPATLALLGGAMAAFGLARLPRLRRS